MCPFTNSSKSQLLKIMTNAKTAYRSHFATGQKNQIKSLYSILQPTLPLSLLLFILKRDRFYRGRVLPSVVACPYLDVYVDTAPLIMRNYEKVSLLLEENEDRNVCPVFSIPLELSYRSFARKSIQKTSRTDGKGSSSGWVSSCSVLFLYSLPRRIL